MTAPLPEELRRVHMVGIGGAGMSGIARILLDRGALVSGSDAKESRGVVALRARGAAIRIGHDASSLDLLPGGPTAVITTHAAIPKTNPELVEARRRAIPIVLRPVVLARLMAGHTTALVTGTHGKTTTTSMLIVALQHAGLDPSFAVGGELGEAGTNAHNGSGTCFVAEADESDGSLLEYTPNVAVVTNIEADHLDYFGSAEAYAEVFDAFIDRIAPGGALVVCTDDPGAADLAGRVAAQGVRVLAYGTDAGAMPLAGRLMNWQQQGTGAVADVQLAGESRPRALRLSVPGHHMALNALGALLAAVEVGAPVDAVLDGLAGFEGVRRRFELVGTANGIRVFDDYAHHPTEVRAALSALRTVAQQSGGGRRWPCFNPTCIRGQRLSLKNSGLHSTAPIASSCSTSTPPGSSRWPASAAPSVAEHVTVPVNYVPDFSAVAARVAEVARPGDVIVTMGAGDVTMLGPEILTALQVAANRNAPGTRGDRE